MLLNCFSGYWKGSIISNKKEDDKVKLKMVFKPQGIKWWGWNSHTAAIWVFAEKTWVGSRKGTTPPCDLWLGTPCLFLDAVPWAERAASPANQEESILPTHSGGGKQLIKAGSGNWFPREVDAFSQASRLPLQPRLHGPVLWCLALPSTKVEVAGFSSYIYHTHREPRRAGKSECAPPSWDHWSEVMWPLGA